MAGARPGEIGGGERGERLGPHRCSDPGALQGGGGGANIDAVAEGQTLERERLAARRQDLEAELAQVQQEREESASRLERTLGSATTGSARRAPAT